LMELVSSRRGPGLAPRTDVPSSRIAMELVIRAGGLLGFSRGAVVIRQRGGGERRVPIYQVDRILTGGVAVSSKLLRECARRFIDVVVFDGRGMSLARVFPPRLTAPFLIGVGARRISTGGGLSWLVVYWSAAYRLMASQRLCTMEGPCGGLMDAAGKCLGA